MPGQSQILREQKCSYIENVRKIVVGHELPLAPLLRPDESTVDINLLSRLVFCLNGGVFLKIYP